MSATAAAEPRAGLPGANSRAAGLFRPLRGFRILLPQPREIAEIFAIRIALELHELDVVIVYMFAGCDVARGDADHRVVLAHRHSLGDRSRGDLLPSRGLGLDRQPLSLYPLT